MELTCSCGGGEGEVRSKCGGGNSLSWRCKIARAYWRWHQLNYSRVKMPLNLKTKFTLNSLISAVSKFQESL